MKDTNHRAHNVQALPDEVRGLPEVIALRAGQCPAGVTACAGGSPPSRRERNFEEGENSRRCADAARCGTTNTAPPGHPPPVAPPPPIKRSRIGKCSVRVFFSACPRPCAAAFRARRAPRSASSPVRRRAPRPPCLLRLYASQQSTRPSPWTRVTSPLEARPVRVALLTGLASARSTRRRRRTTTAAAAAVVARAGCR